MKKINFILVSLIFNILIGQKNPQNTLYLKNKTVENIKLHGSANLNKVLVEDETDITGDLEADNSQFAYAPNKDFSWALNLKGGAKLKNSKIHGNANINGNISSINSSFFKALLVHGKSDLIKTLIKQNSKFYGNTKISDSQFHEDIYIADTDQITAINSVFERGLTLDSDSRQPVINLVNSRVQGEIVFKGRAGVVVLAQKSKISGVTNGKIVKVKK